MLRKPSLSGTAWLFHETRSQATALSCAHTRRMVLKSLEELQRDAARDSDDGVRTDLIEISLWSQSIERLERASRFSKALGASEASSKNSPSSINPPWRMKQQTGCKQNMQIDCPRSKVVVRQCRKDALASPHNRCTQRSPHHRLHHRVLLSKAAELLILGLRKDLGPDPR